MVWYQNRKTVFISMSIITGFLLIQYNPLFLVSDVGASFKYNVKYFAVRNDTVKFPTPLSPTTTETKTVNMKDFSTRNAPINSLKTPLIPTTKTNVVFSEIWKKLTKPHPHSSYPEHVDKHYSQAKQDKAAYGIFPKKNGFFIEMGAYDGKVHSNTLWLERKHNWTGLLIEGNPLSCPLIDRVKRQTWRLCACVSSENETIFIIGSELGGSEKNMPNSHKVHLRSNKRTKVPCFQLYNVLQIVGVFHINYFSLDVEGGEIAVLNSMREQLISKQIIVDVWTIEYRAWAGPMFDWPKGVENLANLRAFFKEIGGYVEHSQLAYETHKLQDGHYLDVVFVYIDTWCKSHKLLPDGKTKC